MLFIKYYIYVSFYTVIAKNMSATHRRLEWRNKLIQARINKIHLCKFEVNIQGWISLYKSSSQLCMKHSLELPYQLCLQGKNKSIHPYLNTYIISLCTFQPFGLRFKCWILILSKSKLKRIKWNTFQYLHSPSLETSNEWA